MKQFKVTENMMCKNFSLANKCMYSCFIEVVMLILTICVFTVGHSVFVQWIPTFHPCLLWVWNFLCTDRNCHHGSSHICSLQLLGIMETASLVLFPHLTFNVRVSNLTLMFKSTAPEGNLKWGFHCKSSGCKIYHLPHNHGNVPHF
jgi:hypothetical protein